jgi:hypothetical protein
VRGHGLRARGAWGGGPGQWGFRVSGREALSGGGAPGGGGEGDVVAEGPQLLDVAAGAAGAVGLADVRVGSQVAEASGGVGQQAPDDQLAGRPETDVLDCQWLARLAEMGLLRPSFVPRLAVRALRDLTRTRLHW